MHHTHGLVSWYHCTHLPLNPKSFTVYNLIFVFLLTKSIICGLLANLYGFVILNTDGLYMDWKSTYTSVCSKLFKALKIDLEMHAYYKKITWYVNDLEKFFVYSCTVFIFSFPDSGDRFHVHYVHVFSNLIS